MTILIEPLFVQFELGREIIVDIGMKGLPTSNEDEDLLW